MKKRYIIPIFVPHLGCPNDCVFCNQKSISGQQKMITKEDIIKKINFYLENIKDKEAKKEVAFFGGSFTGITNGSAKKDTLQQKTSADLSLKVMTAREKTVTLQRNVTQLELALRNKEQRIQLLNARLAELQDQLKVQQETKKPTR